MSVQLAKDEKVIKSFNYATVGYNKKKGQYDTFKSLIVTNKRIIHESINDKNYNRKDRKKRKQLLSIHIHT